jgi:hypothetical protein
VSQQFTNSLRPFNEEDPGLVSARTLRQSLDGLNFGRVDVGDHCSMLTVTRAPALARRPRNWQNNFVVSKEARLPRRVKAGDSNDVVDVEFVLGKHFPQFFFF